LTPTIAVTPGKSRTEEIDLVGRQPAGSGRIAPATDGVAHFGDDPLSRRTGEPVERGGVFDEGRIEPSNVVIDR
jgi:hypothetical protein